MQRKYAIMRLRKQKKSRIGGGEKETEVKIIVAIMIVLMILSRMKWRITALSLIYFMEKNQYKLPDKKEMEVCTGFVIKNIVKDLTGH